MKTSLVIPCYNEARNLPLLVPRCRDLASAGNIEVILVDNGSSDATSEILEELLTGQNAVRSIRVAINQGYGFGILEGLRAARGEALGWTHADMQTDPMDVLAAASILADAADPRQCLVKGRRHGRPIADTAFTVGMSIFETLLMGTVMSDINAQPTLFHRAFFQTWERPPHDFSLDLYAYYLARRAGLRIARLDVNFGARAHGVSHWNVNWIEKQKFIARTIRYSLELRRQLKP